MLIKSLLAVSLMLATPAMAGDHGSHPPMGPPLSVTCALLPPSQQFLCLHPGYAMRVADTLSIGSIFHGCTSDTLNGHVVLHPYIGHPGVLADTCGNEFPPHIPY